jgi:hypothetical protein
LSPQMGTLLFKIGQRLGQRVSPYLNVFYPFR